MTNILSNEFDVFGIFLKLSNITNLKTMTGNIWLVVQLFGNLIHEFIDVFNNYLTSNWLGMMRLRSEKKRFRFFH